MKHVMTHGLSPELARRAAEQAFAAYEQQYARYHPRLTWVSDTKAEASFSAKGFSLRGVVELRPRAIELDLEVPFVLRLFKGKAIEILERELKVWTERAAGGEL